MELFWYFNLVKRQFLKKNIKNKFIFQEIVQYLYKIILTSQCYATMYTFILLLVCLPIAIIFIGHSYFFYPLSSGSSFFNMNWRNKKIRYYYYNLKNYLHILNWCQKSPQLWSRWVFFRYSHFEIHLSNIQQNFNFSVHFDCCNNHS